MTPPAAEAATAVVPTIAPSQPPEGPVAAAAGAVATATGSAVTAESESDGESLGLTASDRRFLWGVGSLGVLLAGVHWLQLSGWGLQEVEIDRLPERQYDFRVDINRATWVEWMQLEGIGELTARRIVADREARGPFRTIDELDRVSGIGPKTLAAIRPWLECPDPAAASPNP